jgi:hypothetical protein
MKHVLPPTIGITFSFLLQGLQRSITSAQVISKTSIDFFKDIRLHVSRLIKLMEQNQMERSSQLVEFEKEFKVVFLYYAMYFIDGPKVSPFPGPCTTLSRWNGSQVQATTQESVQYNGESFKLVS